VHGSFNGVHLNRIISISQHYVLLGRRIAMESLCGISPTKQLLGVQTAQYFVRFFRPLPQPDSKLTTRPNIDTIFV
jgi:hypothetical protein